ncbi:MAG: chorismate mutase [Patescibacteria group bacterium]
MILEIFMNLDVIRKKINNIDLAIIQLIKKRLDLADMAKKSKIKIGLKIIDLKREKEVLKNVNENSKLLDLNEEKIVKLFKIIIQLSRERQQ